MTPREKKRCEWAGSDPLYRAYHDEEWGVPVNDDRLLFEFLILEGAVRNAKAWLELGRDAGSPAEFLWSFVGGRPKRNRFRTLKELPAETDESRAMSKALKRRGFTFVGPTICYAFMQATGMVNDHVVGCFRHREVAALGGAGT